MSVLYRQRDIPKLIIENNLHGLDIDDRAGQLAGFALIMKATGDDRRLLNRDEPLTLNVLSIQENKLIDYRTFVDVLPKKILDALYSLLELFEDAKTYGSLIRVPNDLADAIPALETSLSDLGHNGNLFEKTLVRSVEPFIKQAKMLSYKYENVIMNPPYMGGRGMYKKIKQFTAQHYPQSKSDLFAVFMERSFSLSYANRFIGMITMQSWMFIVSYQKIREMLLIKKTITSMVHLGAGAFNSITGEVVQMRFQ